MEENHLQDHVKKSHSKAREVEENAKHKKNEAKAKRILIDSIKDHLIPHVAELKAAKELYDALVGLFQSDNASTKLALRHQLRSIMMSRSDSIVSYLRRVSQLRDELGVIGDTIDDAELVTATLNGFSSSWDPFVQETCAREKFPKFDKLWTNCVQEKARLLSNDSLQRP